MSILSSLLGITKSQPAQVIPAAVTEPKIAEEIAPFLKDILGKGQALYKQRTEEGFVPYEGQTLADVTAQQQAAQEGIAGLVGTQAPAFEEARGLVRGISERPTAEALEEYMSPYQQAVIDVEKRQAQEAFERETLPKIRQAQIGAGAFGGTRGTMLEAQTLADQARLLADIQTKGQQQAFQSAQEAFRQQKAREAQAAEGLTGLATGQFGAQTKELGALEAVGREQQQRQQQLLDEAYQRFLQERSFPEQQLGQYQALVAGTPISQGNVTYQQAKFQPSPLSQALGTVATGLGTYEGAKNVGLFSKEGGGIKEGLASLPVVKRADAGILIDTEAQRKRPEDEKISRPRSLVVNDKSIGERGSGRFKQIFGTIDREEGEQSQGENLADSFKSFLSSLGINVSKPKDNKLDQQPVSNLTVQQQPIVNQTTPNNVPPGLTADGEFGGKSDYVDPRALDDTIASQVKPDEEEVKDDSIKIPSEQDALKLMSGNISKFASALKTRQDAALKNINASKDALRAQAKVDFLMGLGRGLTKGSGTGGGFLADLTTGGQEAMASIKDFQKDIMTLNKEELAVLDKNVKDQFDLETQRINLAFKQGELTRAERDYKLKERQVAAQELSAGLTRANKSLTTALAIASDDKLTSGQKRQFLDDALANNQITIEHYRIALSGSSNVNNNTGDASGLGETVTITNPQQSGQ
jgi:hypothetical protein